MTESDSRTAERRIMWAALATAAFFGTWAYTAGENPESAWQYAGGVLEIAGFLVVIADLELRLERFGDRPGPFLSAGRWIGEKVHRIAKRLGWKRSRTVQMEATSDGTSASDSAVAKVIPGAPFPGVRGEIVRLERMIGELERQIERVESVAADRRAEMEDRLRGDIAALRGEVEDVKATVRKSVAAGFGLELTGVGLFLSGIILSTWGAAIF